jgi:uncharacterized membrane protein
MHMNAASPAHKAPATAWASRLALAAIGCAAKRRSARRRQPCVLAVRAAVRRWLPHHLLTYILGRGLLGTLLASLLAALLVASHPLWGVGSEAVLVANLLMATDEASICGRLTPILVFVLRTWLATFSERLYRLP